MKDILVILRLKNNLILKRAKDLWGEDVTQQQIAERTNVNYAAIGNILNFKTSPIINRCCSGGTPVSELSGYYWTRVATKISKGLNVLPEYLFPEHLREIRNNIFKIEVESSKLLKWRFPVLLSNPETLLQEKEMKTQVREALTSLKSNQQIVLTRRFGLDDEPETYELIAQSMGLSRERVRQIEMKGLSNLMLSDSVKFLKEHSKQF